MKMKKMKKAAPLVVASIVSASLLLSGCGKNNDQSASNEKPANDTKQEATATNETPATNEAPAAPELAPYKLKMVVPGGAVPKDLALVNEEISKYLKDKINASFELDVIDWGSWQDKVNLKFASSEQFDLLQTMNWDNFGTKIQQGNIIDLTELIDKNAPDLKTVINPALLEGSKVNGRNYGIPINKELASQAGVMLRKDLVDKYKIDITQIKKVEDLEPIYQMIKEKESGVVPLYLNKDTSVDWIYNPMNFEDLGDSSPGSVVRGANDFKVVSSIETPQVKAELDLARKWFLAGYVNKDAATAADISGALKAGKAFSYVQQLKPGKDAEDSLANGVEFVQVELTKPIVRTADTTGSMTSISRTSKDPDRAMMFLNLLYTDKYLVNLLAFGIEGKHFVKKSDNVIDFPEGVDAATSGYVLNGAWMFGNQFNDYLWANENPNKWDNFLKFNESAEKSSVLGFVFNPEPVKNEIAAFNNAKKEFEPALFTGTVDPNEFLPKYINKLKSIGVDKIIAEKQKQLDEWVKTAK
ncbi:carbohydrate ABC transporter substrate-binding protein, CUT1 family [Paenibacillus sp. BC26]|nr:carbohydrate ABC transporter substrate-binding protein, CUT1 family [Paenibacillus sp. BC26]